MEFLGNADAAMLPLGLFGEPVLKHSPREADMPLHANARHPGWPHGLIDPARLDRKQMRCLIWPQHRTLR